MPTDRLIGLHDSRLDAVTYDNYSATRSDPQCHSSLVVVAAVVRIAAGDTAVVWRVSVVGAAGDDRVDEQQASAVASSTRSSSRYIFA